MEGMADTAGTTGNLQSHLLDLSGVPLDELKEVDGLSSALAALQEQLVHTAAPLCQGTMTAMCGSTPWAQAGSGHDS